MFKKILRYGLVEVAFLSMRNSCESLIALCVLLLIGLCNTHARCGIFTHRNHSIIVDSSLKTVPFYMVKSLIINEGYTCDCFVYPARLLKRAKRGIIGRSAADGLIL